MVRRMKIGPRIEKARKLKRLSQGELGRRIGVSQPTVSDWENSRTEPTVDNMRGLAVELEVCFEWMATGRGPMEYRPGVTEPEAEYRIKSELPEDEQELQAIYRKLPPARQHALIEFLRKFV